MSRFWRLAGGRGCDLIAGGQHREPSNMTDGYGAEARGSGDPPVLSQTVQPWLRGQVRALVCPAPPPSALPVLPNKQCGRVSYSLALRRLWESGSGRVGSSHSLGPGQEVPEGSGHPRKLCLR